MEKLQFKILIDAPKAKVYKTTFEAETYTQWTEVFASGSHFVGNWNQGSKILFLAPDKKGVMRGMVSRIKENKPNEFVSIEHLGVVHEGKEDTTSDAVKGWAGALENYTFIDKNGKTEVIIDMDSYEDYSEMFRGMWEKSLIKLKELAEK